MSEIDQRVRELRRELRGLSWRRRRRVLAEARDHLACALEDGLSEPEAVESLGRPDVAFAGLPQRRRPQRLAVVIGPVLLLALAPSLSGTFPRLGSGTTTSEAASPQIVMQRQVAAALRKCVATWNAEPTGQWRAAATQAGIRRARVNIIAIIKLSPTTKKAGRSMITGCNVSLQRALVPSPDQPWINVYAARTGGAFHFDRLLHGHTRTAVPAANALVDSAGRLSLTDRLVYASCPRGPIGSAVTSVQALPSLEALTPGTTTHLPAGSLVTYVVTIRNTGRVTIQDAIASVEIGGKARPGHAWWRSGPRVVQRLAPGAAVSVRFTPPDLGHGTRLVRAASTAIACETRSSDNAPVFQVELT
jgi:hypothetical protein